jgi:Insertion element 4 transposase N-terminal/Transposase DDE domain
MARTAARLPAGSRITDLVTVGVIARTFPIAKVRAVLTQTGRASVRERELPAHVVVYYVITLALFMNASCREVLRCLLEGVQWLSAPRGPVKVTSKSGISQARTRLGSEVMRRLHDEVVRPIATAETKGAWFRRWRLVSLDGSTFDVADDPALEAEFGRPGAGHGESAFPQVRIVCLVENGTHVLFATKMAGCATSELALAREVLPALGEGMLCLADRNFFGFEIWTLAQGTGAELVWRVKQGRDLPEDERLADGSYLSRVYPGDKVRKRQSAGIRVRVIDYRLHGVADAEPMYRLVTTILDPAQGSAQELAALYHERWEIETALGELKTHLRGARIVLRSKTPDLVRQEIHGLLMAHFAIRGLMHEAALGADQDPDRLSFLHAIRVIRRKISAFGVIPPSEQTRAA